MATIRGKPKSWSMRDLALVSSTSFTASTSQDTPQDSGTISELCYPLALAVYLNNHNNVLSDVDEDDDDDNDIYYNQDEDGVVNHAVEQFYLKKIQELANTKLELFTSGELDLDRKKKKQIESFGIQDDLYACEDELVSKKNEMQIYKHQNVASLSKRPHKLVNDEDDNIYRKKKKKKKKQIASFGIQDVLYACEDELVSKQNEMQFYKHGKVASSSRRPHKYIYDEDEEEEYNMKKKRRNKASSSRRPHMAVKDDSNEDNNKKNNPEKKIEPIITNDITEHLKEHITHHLNGANIMLVIQKKLFASDLARDQNRLTMPCNQVQTSDFFTEQERRCLEDRVDIDVPLLGPTLQLFNQPMKLVKWPINTTHSYILRTNWNNFVRENKNDLKKGAIIQVWSYRQEDQNKLCFAIAVVKRAD